MSIVIPFFQGLFIPVSYTHLDIDWTQRARQLEKGFTYENRLSELTYKVKGDNVDNLSAAKDDEKDLGNTAIDWVAFKNQFFSSVFIADQDFNKVSVLSLIHISCHHRILATER